MAIAFDQAGYRFRNDDGTEITATWLAAVNTNISVDVGSGNVSVRVRIAAQNLGTTTGTMTGILRFSLNGGAYAAIGIATTGAKVINSTFLTDDAATTQQISAFTFISGKVDDVDGTTTATASCAQNVGTEHEYMIQLVSADLADGNTLDFREYRSGVAFTTYTQTGRITIIKNPPPAGHGNIPLINAETERTLSGQPIYTISSEKIRTDA